MRPYIAFVAACVFTAQLTAANSSAIAGTWEGSSNGLPSVELTIQDSPHRMTGSIGFYFQTRGADGTWHVGDKYTVPLLHPRLRGTVLTFETIHHKKHSSPELGPNNKYRVDFVGANEARLHIVKRSSNGDDSGLQLTRRH